MNATSLKEKFNEVFWVDELGMYRDNDTTTLCPQDANSMAVQSDDVANAGAVCQHEELERGRAGRA